MRAEPAASEELLVRDLLPGDLDAVGPLVRTSFGESLRPYLVPTQEGWIDHLALVLQHPASFPSHRPAVIADAAGVLGFADYRETRPGQGFLSYICVSPEARGRGVARRLLTTLVRRHGHHEVALDVFEDNLVALALYRSMGFLETARSVWWRDALPDPTQPARLTGLPAAAASLRTYGFCEITGELDGRDFRYGRTGRGVLRAFSVEDFDDRVTAAALAATFPDLDELFAVLPWDDRPASPTATPILTSIHMIATHLVLPDRP